MTEKQKGALLTVVAAIAWGISGISGEYLMTHGMAVNHLSALRLIISGLFLTAIAYVTNKESLMQAIKDWKSLLGIGLFAILGLALNQYAYLSAVAYTNAGTATVLQYMSPVLVLIYICLRQKTWPTVLDVVAIVLAIVGTVFLATHGDLTQLSISPFGLFWGLFSAVTYAFYILLPARSIRRYGSLVVIGLGMLMGGALFSILTQPWQYQYAFDGKSLLALFGIVGVGTIFAYSLFLKGVTLVGPVNASLLASIEPVAAVFFSIVIMKAHFFALDLMGVALILGAVLLISLKDLNIRKRRKLPGDLRP
ncbi:DMT family transporter [Streptococcus moroccensis]|uniref:Drug/metabolite transporter (DMT)-like permease n=1 Tax=Streptococcus moroccensis TaxID=1451356 RepID=A0ABT9YNV1_9STRE|nr:DMT family transporter [Streptococcus moroccensis]MDQ0221653.1 drug/metabolite transporter (DMT)-like permease [Streptococcus moroccensis]